MTLTITDTTIEEAFEAHLELTYEVFVEELGFESPDEVHFQPEDKILNGEVDGEVVTTLHIHFLGTACA